MNGIQDPGEAGLPTVQVTLYRADGTLVATTITDGSGFYRFSGVNAGEYFLLFTPPNPAGEPYVLAPVDQGDQFGGGVMDSDVNPATNQSALFSLAPGESNLTWDAGFYAPMRIGSLVWHDKNNNGVVDGGEHGLPNVILQLFREGDDPAATTPLATTTSDANGSYVFGNLPPGRYFVYLPTPPVGYPLSSMPTDPADNGEDNDDNGQQGALGAPIFSPIIDLTSQSETTNDGDGVNSDQTVDFGFFALSSIGDLVWYDANGNGLQDVDENGVSGVIVTLYRVDGSLAATTSTDGEGHYLFSSLPPGDYYLTFTPPPGYAITQPNGGDPTLADAVDSDVDPTTGRTAIITLGAIAIDMTQDLGLTTATLPATVAGVAWLDSNQNGIHDGDESMVAGVEVMLYTTQGVLVATTATDQNGHYQFGNLIPSDYYLVFATPNGYQSTLADQGGDDGADSDVLILINQSIGQTTIITLQSSENQSSWDYGLQLMATPGQLPASIGNRVWLDLNGNGLQDNNEIGFSDVVVKLYNATGELLAVDVTDSNGNYRFDSLPPGVYFVEFVLPDEFEFSPPGFAIGSDISSDQDSNADPSTGRTDTITVQAGTVDLSWDAGVHQKPTSLEDADEPGRREKQVYLPLVARTGLKIKEKLVRDAPEKLPICQGRICLMP